MRRALTRLACLLFLLAAVPAAAQPLLWHVSGKHNTVFLLGAIHALRDSDYPLPSVVQRAYTQADIVVVEVDPAELKSLDFARTALKLGKFKDGTQLSDVVAPDTYKRVRAAARDAGMNPARLKHFKPWLAAITLTGLKMRAAGFESALGIDSVLGTRAHHDNKSVISLESARFQLQLFDSMPAVDQERFLKTNLDQISSLDNSMQKIVTIWRNGDAQALAKLERKEFADTPQLYQRLLKNRNDAWLPEINHYLHADSDYLVVVGAMHLVGEDGLVEQLRKAGYRIQRL